MKKLFMVAIMVLVLLGGLTAGIGFVVGRNTAQETTETTVPSDEDLVREFVVEDKINGDYVIEITKDQGDGYIDYFVYDENGNVVMCGYINREYCIEQWNEKL